MSTLVSPYLHRPHVVARTKLPQPLLEFIRVVTLAFVLPLLPSLLWWLQMRSSLLFRGWVNVEYTLLLCAALLAPSRRMTAILTLELSISLLEPIAHLFYFSPSDAFLSLRYLALIPLPRLVAYLGLFLLYTAANALLLHVLIGSRRPITTRWSIPAVLICVVLFTSFDVATGRHNFFLRGHAISGDTDVRRGQAARFPVISILDGMSVGLTHPEARALKPLPSALNKALSDSNLKTQPDIVMVLTESWGLAADPAVNHTLTAPYRAPAIQDLYQVETGTVPFLGGTTSGETRELCGDSHGRSDLGLPSGYFADCWPSRLTGKNYTTLAVHGFTPSMFRRDEWYAHFGFAESDFLPQLDRDGAHLCNGAFLGVCDADVAAWIGRRLAAPRDRRPMFLYWVSLNSHLPVAPVPGDAPAGDCSLLAIDQESSLCAWFHRVLIVHDSVARIAVQSLRRPTIFVIVGDHAPPFLQTASREKFSQTDVPYVLLVPRSLQSPQRNTPAP